jgi:hypothetical protein
MSRSWLSDLVGKPLGTRRHRPRSRRVRLWLEGLEDRTVLSFLTPTTFAVGTSPHGEAVGDFNGDSKADLVVVNQASNTLSVLLGKGDGTFQPKTDYATGASPAGVAVGDFNGDGKADVAVANKGAKSVSILLGNGDGTFGAKTDIALPLTPVALTVGDFNGDGKADIAVATFNANQDSVTTLLGNGNGTFQLPVTTVTDTITFVGGNDLGLAGTGVSSVQSGDFNGDGHADLVVVNNKDDLQVTARARFGGIISTAVFPEPGSVSVLLGNGDGTLQAPRTFAVGSGAESVAIGDFNNDGRLDFAVNNSASGSVSIFMNSGGGNFSSSTTLVGSTTSTVAAGDFNGDGVTDLAVPGTFFNGNTGFSLIKVFTGQTGGTLQAGPTYALGLAFPVVGDFNGDGRTDLAGAAGNAIEPWLAIGNGTLQAPYLIPAAGVTLASQATGDFNGDGIPDLVSASTGQVQLGLGDGRFGDPTTLPIPGGSTVAAVDADGNGTVDVLVGNPGYPTGQVAAWFNSPGYDNRTGGAVGFTVSAPTQIAAGDNASVTVTAVDALGNPVPGFLGTVDLDFTPAGSTALNLAGQYTFTAADNGRHTFLFSNLTQAGADTLSVFAVGMPTATAPLTVVPAALSKFAIAAPATIPAGTPFSFTVTPEDRFGNVETGYTGTVHFSALANDTQAVLPVDYTFTAADAGKHSFGATLFKTAGASSPFVSAKDLTTGVNTSATIVVTPLAPASLSVTGLPNPYTAGTAAVAVTVVDIYGNRASGYTGTIHFSSSDAQASLPADYTFTAGDAGTHTFVVTLKTPGTQSFGVADTVNAGFSSTQSGIVVIPAPASVFTITGLPSTTTAGVSQTFVVTAFDAFGNRAQYFGSVVFSSSDSQASLPSFCTFTAADAGSHTFSAALKTAGTQSLTVRDFFNVLPSGTQSIAVNPASAASFTVGGFPTATTAGVPNSFTVTAMDAFGNVATGYTGTVAFTSSDPIASLPPNYTFTAADAGTHTFSAALKRAGAQYILATDTLASSVVGFETGIAVTPAAVSQFAISGPTSVTQGVGFKITVTAEDAFGNLNTGYRGTVHLSSTDSTGGTQNFTFSSNDNGVHIFSYTFNALGFQTLTVTDTTNSTIPGTIVMDVLPKSGGGGGGGGGVA